MHTLIMTGIGVALLAAFTLGAGRFNARRAGRALSGPLLFLPLWLAVSSVNFFVGVFFAGYSVRDELLVHAIIFGVPALLAFLLIHRERASRGASRVY